MNFIDYLVLRVLCVFLQKLLFSGAGWKILQEWSCLSQHLLKLVFPPNGKGEVQLIPTGATESVKIFRGRRLHEILHQQYLIVTNFVRTTISYNCRCCDISYQNYNISCLQISWDVTPDSQLFLTGPHVMGFVRHFNKTSLVLLYFWFLENIWLFCLFSVCLFVVVFLSQSWWHKCAISM